MKANARARVLAGAATVVVIATVIAGLIAIGPPGLQRERKLDKRRVHDLATLTRLLNVYLITTLRLPPDLDTLAKSPGVRVPTDPQTGAMYEFIATGDKTYRLCAVFSLDTSLDPRTDYYPIEDKWLHGAGRTCFDRNVDKVSQGE